MIQGTTPTAHVTVPIDLTDATEIELWIREVGGNHIVLLHRLDDLTVVSSAEQTVLSYTLTEAESLELTGYAADIQCRWKYDDGTIGAMEPERAYIDRSIWDVKMRE